MPRTEYVRVRTETGAHKSIPKVKYDADQSSYTLLKQDATDSAGTPLPDKTKTAVSTETTSKSTAKSGQQAETSKEKS